MVLRTSLRRPQSKCALWAMTAAVAAAISLGAQTARAENPVTQARATDIARVHATLEQSAKLHLTNVQVGVLWARLASDLQDETEFAQAESAYMRALSIFHKDPHGEADYATTLGYLGSLYLVTSRYDEAEHCRREALEIRLRLGNPEALMLSYVQLAEVDLAKHRFKDVEESAVEALHVYDGWTNPGIAGMKARVPALVALSYARCYRDNCAEGLKNAEEAVSIAEASGAANAALMPHARLALGFAQWKTGSLEAADENLRHGVELMRTLTAPSDPLLLDAMNEYRMYLDATHRKREARAIDMEIAKQMQQWPHECSGCVVNVYALSGNPGLAVR